MNGKELAFCAHYAVHRSPQKAALAAGYSPTHARKHAYKILQRTHIQDQLNWLAERQNEIVALDAAVVVNELGAIALTRPDELMEQVDGLWVNKSPEQLTERQRAAVKKIDVRTDRETGEQQFSYQMHDKMAALYKLGDHYGLGADADSRKGNPFEDMEQEELDQIQGLMEKAMDRKAITGEVVDA